MILARAKAWWTHPSMRDVDLDDPSTTERRRRLIQQKRFLRRLYEEWYRAIASLLPVGREPVVEIGSGPGFLAEFVPGLVTADLRPCRGVSVVFDAARLPFRDKSLRAIAMTNVLHHLPQSRRFLHEAARCVRPGGALLMIEPWVSSWSTFVYSRFHHEPFRHDASEWEFAPTGPLSGANGALPWILFVRDRGRFERECPHWEIRRIRPGWPFRYLLSGGVSFRAFAPSQSFWFWRALERALQPWMERWAMFAEIELVRRSDEARAGGTGQWRSIR